MRYFYLNFCRDGNGMGEWYHLAMEAAHCQDLTVVFGELHAINPGKELLEVGLDDGRLGGLAQDLQQVVIANEIEAGKGRTLLLQSESKAEKEDVATIHTRSALYTTRTTKNGLPS